MTKRGRKLSNYPAKIFVHLDPDSDEEFFLVEKTLDEAAEFPSGLVAIYELTEVKKTRYTLEVDG